MFSWGLVIVSLVLLSRVQLWQADAVGARGMTYQQQERLFRLVFLYEHQQILPGYVFTFSSVNRWAWSTGFPSQCNAGCPTWWTSAATNDTVTSTSHDAWNTSLQFCSISFISSWQYCQLLWGEAWLVTTLPIFPHITPPSLTTLIKHNKQNFLGAPNLLTRGISPGPHWGQGDPWPLAPLGLGHLVM